MFAAIITHFFPAWRTGPWVALGLTVLLSAGIGFFDGLLNRKLPRQDGNPVPSAMVVHVLTFMLLQVIITPLTVLALAFGMCTFL